MFSAAHMAIAASTLPRRWTWPVVFVTAMATHYLADAIPHGDHGLGTWMSQSFGHFSIVIGPDMLLAVMTIILIRRWRVWPSLITTLAVTLGAITPDILTWARYAVANRIGTVPIVTPFLNGHEQWHEIMHVNNNIDVPFWAGLVIQVIIATICWRRLRKLGQRPTGITSSALTTSASEPADHRA